MANMSTRPRSFTIRDADDAAPIVAEAEADVFVPEAISEPEPVAFVPEFRAEPEPIAFVPESVAEPKPVSAPASARARRPRAQPGTKGKVSVHAAP